MSKTISETNLLERGFSTNQFYGDTTGIAALNNQRFPLSGGRVLTSTPSTDAASLAEGHSLVEPITALLLLGLNSSNSNNITDSDVTDNKTRDFNNTTTPVIYYTMSDKYHREDERVKTFDRWPLPWLDKAALAMTGMFYIGEEDKVKCYFCEVVIGRWDREDQPVPEHLRWSPNCPLLRRRPTNNVPIDAEALDRLLPPLSYDVCGLNDTIEMRPQAYAESPISMSYMMPLQQTTPATANFPMFREYAIETARVRSFNEWPRYMKQKPEEMAAAGFFYTGTGDRVKCFSCGGGLKDWDAQDDPWEQHAIWLTNCRYLKLIKGQQFIDEAIAKQKARDSAEVAAILASRAAATTATPDTDAAANDVSSSVTQQTTTFCANAMTAMCAMSTAPAPDACEMTNETTNNAINAANCSTITTQPQAVSGCENNPNQNGCEQQEDTIKTVAPTTIASTSLNSAGTPTKTIPEEKLCKICYANEYNTVFSPCGHVVACAKCASSVTKCPLCRKPFTDVMRLYYS